MFKLFTKITGDDYNMLINDTPSSRKKVVLLANTLFVPVLLWFFSTYAMAIQFFGASLFGGLVAGIISGLIIFIIERSILMASGNRWIVVFRLTLGLCIATIGSFMLDQIFFKSDIEKRLNENKEITISNEKAKIENEYKATLALLQTDKETKNKSWAIALKEVSKESDGSGGSTMRGNGDITKLKRELANENYSDYQRAINDLKNIQQVKQSKLEKVEAEINSNSSGNMLLNRIKAMSQLVCSDGAMFAVYLIFTIIIWCLEFMVVLIKMNHSETNYERRLRTIEAIGEHRISEIAKKDREWYDGGKGHSEANDLKAILRKNPPTFFN